MRSFSKQRLYANAMPAPVVLCGCISTSNKIIEACLLQWLGLNDCVCFRSLIEYTLYFIMTFLNTHKTSSPADQMSANWEFFLFLSFPFSFLLSPLFSFCFTCFTLLFLLCLTAFIQHLKQFLSFHLMEAEGRQNDAIIKHALYNSRAVWAPCCDTASHWPNVSLPFLSYLSRDFCPSWAQNSGPISYFLIYRHIVFVHC